MMPANEYYPCFPGCARLAPSALPFFEANMSRAAEAIPLTWGMATAWAYGPARACSSTVAT